MLRLLLALVALMSVFLLRAAPLAAAAPKSAAKVDSPAMVLGEAIGTLAQVEDPDQRAVALTAIAETQSRLGQATEAMATARRIAGVPNCVKAGSLAGVGAACAVEGCHDQARQLFAEAVKLADTAGTSEEHEYVSAVIIGEQIKARYFAEASALAHRLGAKRQIIALIRIAVAQGRARAVAEAGRTLDEVIVLARTMNVQAGETACALELAAGAQAAAGLVAQSRHTFAEAVAAAKRIGDENQKACRLRALATDEVKAGREAAAIELGARLKDDARRTFGEAVAAARAASEDVAYDLADLMADRTVARDAWADSGRDEVWAFRAPGRSAILRAIVASETAAGLLTEATGAARAIDMACCRADAFSAIAVAQAKAGLKGPSQQSFSEAQAAADAAAANSSARRHALCAIAAAQAAVGRFDQAARTIGAIPYIQFSPDDSAYEMAVDATEAGLDAAARGSARGMASTCIKLNTYVAIAKRQLAAGRLAEALATTEEMPDATFRVLLQLKIAAAHADAGDGRRAGKTIDRILPETRKTHEGADEDLDDSRPGVLLQAAIIQAKVGLFSQATATAREIKTPDIRIVALCEVTLARSGKRRLSAEGSKASEADAGMAW